MGEKTEVHGRRNVLTGDKTEVPKVRKTNALSSKQTKNG